MKNSLTKEDLLVILNLLDRIWAKESVLTRSELDLLDKLQDIKEKLK